MERHTSSEGTSQNNPEYTAHHPGSIEDIDKAYDVARAINWDEMNSAIMRSIVRSYMIDDHNHPIHDGTLALYDTENYLDTVGVETGASRDEIERAVEDLGDLAVELDVDRANIPIDAIINLIKRQNEHADKAALLVSETYDKLQQTKR